MITITIVTLLAIGARVRKYVKDKKKRKKAALKRAEEEEATKVEGASSTTTEMAKDDEDFIGETVKRSLDESLETTVDEYAKIKEKLGLAVKDKTTKKSFVSSWLAPRFKEPKEGNKENLAARNEIKTTTAAAITNATNQQPNGVE